MTRVLRVPVFRAVSQETKFGGLPSARQPTFPPSGSKPAGRWASKPWHDTCSKGFLGFRNVVLRLKENSAKFLCSSIKWEQLARIRRSLQRRSHVCRKGGKCHAIVARVGVGYGRAGVCVCVPVCVVCCGVFVWVCVGTQCFWRNLLECLEESLWAPPTKVWVRCASSTSPRSFGRRPASPGQWASRSSTRAWVPHAGRMERNGESCWFHVCSPSDRETFFYLTATFDATPPFFADAFCMAAVFCSRAVAFDSCF